jgi:hypothetical protein
LTQAVVPGNRLDPNKKSVCPPSSLANMGHNLEAFTEVLGLSRDVREIAADFLMICRKSRYNGATR